MRRLRGSALPVLLLILAALIAGTIFYVSIRQTSFVAVPKSGFVPLTVNFESWYGMPEQTPDRAYVINFGDGASQPIYCSSIGDGECLLPVFTDHTYVQGGTYTASLSETFLCPQNTFCANPPAPPQIISTIVITVSG